jgi:hypothetical protein
VHRSIAALATIALAATTVVLASPAQAYDRDAYSYAAGHMINRSDIPKELGRLKKTLSFNADRSGIGSGYLCSAPSSEPNGDPTDISYRSGKFSFTGDYLGVGTDAPSVSVHVDQYATATRAIAAFETVTKRVKSCTGTGTGSWTDPDDGSTTTYSTLVTNGVVPSVTTVGVESVFVNTNSLQETTPGDSKYVNDQYMVLSLVNNVIISTTYFTNTNENLTTKQRKAVNQVAFNAIGRWVE